MNREPIKIIGDILKNCMTLADDQIFIYNQDFKLPETSGLFVLMQYNTSANYSSTNEFIPADEGVEGGQESISMLTKEDYTINVISKNDEARQRKEEVIMSLNSNFSQDQQGLYQFQIARVSNSFVNVSELEGAGMLNRFAINISLLAHYNKTIDTTYYDDFTNQIEFD
jgi:hypothetical protein